jgi:hypothetical protein
MLLLDTTATSSGSQEDEVADNCGRREEHITMRPCKVAMANEDNV